MNSGAMNNPAALKRLRKRYREEGRFRAYGLAAIIFAIASLVVLLVSIVSESVSAFTKHELSLELTIDPAVVDPTGKRDPAVLAKNVSAFSDLVRDSLKHHFPEASGDMALRRQLNRMVSTLAGADLAKKAAANPAMIGQKTKVVAPVSDVIDLYLKGLITDERVLLGNAAASVSHIGNEATVRAAGGFKIAYDDLVDRLRDEAESKNEAAAVSQVSVDRVTAQLAERETRRADLAAADLARITTEASEIAGQGKADDIALLRLAGAINASGDLAPLRTALAKRLNDEAARVEKEANDLLARGANYASKAAEAEKSGEPTAETRRIQAETAYLASDRRRVDATLLKERAGRVSGMGSGEMIATLALITGRPVAPIAELTAAGAADTKRAVMQVNQAEIAAADLAAQDQQERIAKLTEAAAVLKSTAPKRANAVEKTAIPAAKSRLTRLARDSETRRRTGGQLAGLIPFDAPATAPAQPTPAAPTLPSAPSLAPDPAPAAAPVDGATLVATERVAQLGLDLGGAQAIAFALGAAEAKVPNSEGALKALILAHADADIAKTRADIERLTRKRERDTQLANNVLALIGTAGAAITPDEFSPSLLVEINGGVVKAKRIAPDEIAGDILIPISDGAAQSGQWRMRELKVAEADRLVTDRQAAWANALKASGEIRSVANIDLLTKSDSTYPELAGLAAALAGSFWIMAVTLLLSLPIGVAAAIYLEEFAPRNRITDFIEVNINNLAAVPSIVFGLLGAAVFINFFDLPRSAPLVGGLVLSLITLPTIIIATRAALGAVPPSIREGALAVGASLPQTVFHHVLPLAAPGIMTGAIIGLARALGETAPLLLIGMVAFVADPPDGPMDSATALPVLVYKWSSSAERAWQPMTSASIIVLLVFMFAMNALAVYLRRRLERRW
jgi:phosphate ABC transporter permease subunit PstA